MNETECLADLHDELAQAQSQPLHDDIESAVTGVAFNVASEQTLADDVERLINISLSMARVVENFQAKLETSRRQVSSLADVVGALDEKLKEFDARLTEVQKPTVIYEPVF